MKYNECLKKCIEHAKSRYSPEDFVKVEAMYRSYPEPNQDEWDGCISNGACKFYYGEPDGTPTTSPKFLVYMALYELKLHSEGMSTVSAKRIMDVHFDLLQKENIHIYMLITVLEDLFLNGGEVHDICRKEHEVLPQS